LLHWKLAGGKEYQIMKKLVLFCLFLAGLSSLADVERDNPFTLRKETKSPLVRVMTYNVRNSASDKKTENCWSKRRNHLAKLIESQNVDVIGFQEVLPDQRKWLEARFPEFVFSGEGRNADRKNGESSPVAFRASRFDLIKTGTFWLSETPDVPGSKSWGAAFPRICTYAILKDKKTRKAFCFANTHTDHKSKEAREKGMLLIINRMKEFGKGAPIVFVGDHNCFEYEPPAKAVAKLLKDAMYLSRTPPQGSWRTFNFWKWREKEMSISEALMKPVRKRSVEGHKSDMKRIDFIYVSSGTKVLDYCTVPATVPGTQRYLSDHFPTVATIKLRGRK
jgi:endonuclease/exonuclease/phosphatase family metal-dependent hydrolase